MNTSDRFQTHYQELLFSARKYFANFSGEEDKPVYEAEELLHELFLWAAEREFLNREDFLFQAKRRLQTKAFDHYRAGRAQKRNVNPTLRMAENPDEVARITANRTGESETLPDPSRKFPVLDPVITQDDRFYEVIEKAMAYRGPLPLPKKYISSKPVKNTSFLHGWGKKKAEALSACFALYRENPLEHAEQLLEFVEYALKPGLMYAFGADQYAAVRANLPLRDWLLSIESSLEFHQICAVLLRFASNHNSLPNSWPADKRLRFLHHLERFHQGDLRSAKELTFFFRELIDPELNAVFQLKEPNQFIATIYSTDLNQLFRKHLSQMDPYLGMDEIQAQLRCVAMDFLNCILSPRRDEMDPAREEEGCNQLTESILHQRYLLLAFLEKLVGVELAKAKILILHAVHGYAVWEIAVILAAGFTHVYDLLEEVRQEAIAYLKG